MNDSGFPHLWIPDEEVEQLDKKPMKILEDRGLNHGEHGASLSNGLQSIVEAYKHLEADSLSDEELVVFKMILPEGEDIYSQKSIAEKEGLKINAVKDKRHAVVSTSKSMFERLRERVGNYRDSGRLNYFQYVDSFEPFAGEEKQATSLKKYLEAEKDAMSVDVQIMFTPNLEVDVQSRVVAKMIEKHCEFMNDTKQYSLSDGTAVIRADVKVREIKAILDDPAIYRIEQTGFFQLTPSAITGVRKTDKQLDPAIEPDNLPIVVVLDSGVEFSDEYKELVPVHWTATGVKGKGSSHGTEVASKVIFSHIGLQFMNPYLQARAKVIDCDIYGADKSIPQDIMSARIEEAVGTFSDVAKIFNLSSNIPRPIEGDELSILGYQLDSLMRKYHVKFVVSAGNHELAKTCNNLEDILDDDDARIAEPADAMLGITVGAIAGIDNTDMFSKKMEPTAYTRVGPGFAGYYKPDLVAFGGNLNKDYTIPATDPFTQVIIPGGKIGFDVGTSFTAPVVAGDLAEVAAELPGEDIVLAQAVLYNGAERFWNTKKLSKDEAIYLGNQFGRGLSVPKNCKSSSPYKVTFLRSGSLKKKTKEHVRFLMPEIQAKLKGNNTTRITVTCITDAPFDKTKGEQYLGACITADLHKPENGSGKKLSANPNNSDNKGKWDTCNHFTKTFSRFDSGMWEVWLDLFTKWDIDDTMEIPYHLVVTIEDLTQTNNIYEAIIKESAGRFKPVETVRIPIRN